MNCHALSQINQLRKIHCHADTSSTFIRIYCGENTECKKGADGFVQQHRGVSVGATGNDELTRLCKFLHIHEDRITNGAIANMEYLK